MFGISFNKPESVFHKNYRRQLAATLIGVNLIALAHGIGTGWLSPMLLKIQSNDSPLDFSVSVQEASWIGALLSVGALTGNMIFGILVDIIGRKKCIYLLAGPYLCFWTMVFFASAVEYLFTARILAGLTGGAMYITIPIYIADIADIKIRGALSSLLVFAVNIGILLGYIIGSHIPYLIIPGVVGIIPLIYLLLAIRLPDTPQYLLRKGLTDEAEKSLKFYKNFDGNSSEEYEKFKADFNELQMFVTSSRTDQRITVQDVCSKKSLKGLLTAVLLMAVYSFSGQFTIISYSSMIFAETHSTMDPNLSTVIIGVVQILGSYCATFLVDKHGRKFLLMASTAGMCLGLTMIGTYSYLTNHNGMASVNWLPVVVMSFVVFTATIGIAAVTFVTVVEVLPPRVRSFGTTLGMVLMNILVFTCMKMFPVIMAAIGLSAVMWIFAAFSGSGFIYFLICLRETKGMSLDDENNYN